MIKSLVRVKFSVLFALSLTTISVWRTNLLPASSLSSITLTTSVISL